MQVNYVREHERFIEYAADERVPANVQLLWYALMHIFNQRAEGSEWPDGFIRITNDRLFTYLPIKWDAMAKARNALKQMGRIDFRNGNRNKAAPEYRIIPFYPPCYPFKTDNAGGNSGGNEGGNQWGNTGDNMGDINININKTYTENQTEREKDDEDDVFHARARTEAVEDAFREDVGREAYPAEIVRIIHAARMLGLNEFMAGEAVREAARHGARDPVGYAVALLEEWQRNEVRKPEQIGEYMAEKDVRSGKVGLYAVSDPRENAERRRTENREAGIL